MKLKAKTRLRQLRREKSARENREVYAHEVASAIGLSDKNWLEYETNKKKDISFELMARICAYYGIGIDQLIELTEEERKQLRETGSLSTISRSYEGTITTPLHANAVPGTV